MTIHKGKRFLEPAASGLIRAAHPAEAEKIQEIPRHHCIVERTIDAVKSGKLLEQTLYILNSKK